jgi:hypothetical protein
MILVILCVIITVLIVAAVVVWPRHTVEHFTPSEVKKINKLFGSNDYVSFKKFKKEFPYGEAVMYDDARKLWNQR